MPCRRVLVAEDDLDAAESLGLLLSMSGNEVRIVHDGLTAVEEAARFRPHVLLLDIDLPGQNGYAAAREVAERLDYRPVFVALTGSGDREDRRRAKAAGFQHHMVKPIDMAALEAFIEALPVDAG